MSARIKCAGLQVDPEIHALLENEILPGTGLEADAFWRALADIVKTFTPRNRELLAVRDDMQAKISAWHKAHPGTDYDRAAYKAMLEDIDYLLPQPAPFKIATQNVDPEIAEIAGPQLVVPVMNARYALNAANARWGSLYDALYGTDVISEEDGAVRAGAYNPVRGHKVIEWARASLTHFPLNQGSHKQAAHYTIVDGDLLINQIDGSLSMLAAPDQFVGFAGMQVIHQVSCLSTMASTLKYKSTVSTQWEARMPQASKTYALNRPSRPFKTVRVRLRQWTLKTRPLCTATGWV